METQKLKITGVVTPQVGYEKAREFLYKFVDEDTLLFLSGGTTPKLLYQQLAADKKIRPNAVALIDERYGDEWHEKSNEKMIRDTNLIDYCDSSGIPFYRILEGKSRQETARDYELMMHFLLEKTKRKIAVMGIGTDGHTAGIPSGVSNFKFQVSSGGLIATYNDENGMYGERITVTFDALEKIDQFVLLVFGEDKKEAMLSMFQEGPEEEIPARFYTKPDVAKRTLLITDQKV